MGIYREPPRIIARRQPALPWRTLLCVPRGLVRGYARCFGCRMRSYTRPQARPPRGYPSLLKTQVARDCCQSFNARHSSATPGLIVWGGWLPASPPERARSPGSRPRAGAFLLRFIPAGSDAPVHVTCTSSKRRAPSLCCGLIWIKAQVCGVCILQRGIHITPLLSVVPPVKTAATE